jgi:hypothetical protein
MLEMMWLVDQVGKVEVSRICAEVSGGEFTQHELDGDYCCLLLGVCWGPFDVSCSPSSMVHELFT